MTELTTDLALHASALTLPGEDERVVAGGTKMALLSAGLALMLGNELALRGMVVGLVPILLAVEAERDRLALGSGVTLLHTESTLLQGEATLASVTESTADIALGNMTVVSSVSVLLAIGAEPTVLRLVSQLLAVVAVGDSAVSLVVTVLSALFTDQEGEALLTGVTELAAMLTLGSGAVLSTMTTHLAGPARSLGTITHSVTGLLAVETSRRHCCCRIQRPQET